MIKLASRMRNWKFHRVTWVNCISAFVQFLIQYMATRCTRISAHRHVYALHVRVIKVRTEYYIRVDLFNCVKICRLLYNFPMNYKAASLHNSISKIKFRKSQFYTQENLLLIWHNINVNSHCHTCNTYRGQRTSIRLRVLYFQISYFRCTAEY